MELMPELEDIYLDARERKTAKYHEDWDISSMNRDQFSPFKPQPKLVTRNKTKVKPNDRSTMLLYLN